MVQRSSGLTPQNSHSGLTEYEKEIDITKVSSGVPEVSWIDSHVRVLPRVANQTNLEHDSARFSCQVFAHLGFPLHSPLIPLVFASLLMPNVRERSSTSGQCNRSSTQDGRYNQHDDPLFA